jgi:hypothetical protein
MCGRIICFLITSICVTLPLAAQAGCPNPFPGKPSPDEFRACFTEISDLRAKIQKLEDITSILESALKQSNADLARLRTQIVADVRTNTKPGAPINTNLGVGCDKGEAISQMTLSSVSFSATVTCVSVRPDLR